MAAVCAIPCGGLSRNRLSAHHSAISKNMLDKNYMAQCKTSLTPMSASRAGVAHCYRKILHLRDFAVVASLVHPPCEERLRLSAEVYLYAHPLTTPVETGRAGEGSKQLFRDRKCDEIAIAHICGLAVVGCHTERCNLLTGWRIAGALLSCVHSIGKAEPHSQCT
jgi:hypothetical protein